MSAIIQPFPRSRTAQTQGPQTHGPDAAKRYVHRAQEAFDLLAVASTPAERTTLCDIAEIWLDMAEGALPAHP
jgi:hypothetical protein